MKAVYAPYRLIFKNPSGTSRGILTYKDTYFIKIWDEENPGHYGIGECALFKGLSKEDNNTYEDKLRELCENIAKDEATDLSAYSSIMFGFEGAIFDFSSGGKRIMMPSQFTAGDMRIPINGLVWMGSKDEMISRIDEKVKAGFHTIKLKVGAIDFESELLMVKHIREKYSEKDLEIRLDANGGFTAENALERLDRFSKYNIHSIEQPVKAGQFDVMKDVCEKSAIPVALDEELIGISDSKLKEEMIQYIKPKYIILKPSLMGGLNGAEEWLRIAAANDVGGWITSALESNIGLNQIAQWTATLMPRIPQGLGTGNLYTNNIESPLFQEKDSLGFDPDKKFVIPDLDWR